MFSIIETKVLFRCVMSIMKIWHYVLFVVGFSSCQTLYAATCDYRILSEWGSGFTVEVVITNDTSEPIQGWSVTWEYTDGSNIPQAWNANLVGQNPYTATDVGYNATIQPNSFITFGFNGNKSVQGSAAQIPELGGVCADELPPVNEPPIAVINASPTQGSTPLTVTFDATDSSDPENEGLNYFWDFGNGDISTESVVTRTFDQEGNYSVSLVVNDGQLDSTEAFTTIVATDPDDAPNGYVLDAANSSLYFVTSRRIHDLETHQFTDLFGSISESGEASLGINLNSVETGVDLRNERIRVFLFQVAIFGGEAMVTLPVDLPSLSAQSTGTAVTERISATLNLHGVSAAIDTDVIITKLSETQIMVQNASPIVIHAEDYALVEGIEVLRGLANLPVISYSVPVNFTLIYNAQ